MNPAGSNNDEPSPVSVMDRKLMIPEPNKSPKGKKDYSGISVQSILNHVAALDDVTVGMKKAKSAGSSANNADKPLKVQNSSMKEALQRCLEGGGNGGTTAPRTDFLDGAMAGIKKDGKKERSKHARKTKLKPFQEAAQESGEVSFSEMSFPEVYGDEHNDRRTSSTRGKSPHRRTASAPTLPEPEAASEEDIISSPRTSSNRKESKRRARSPRRETSPAGMATAEDPMDSSSRRTDSGKKSSSKSKSKSKEDLRSSTTSSSTKRSRSPKKSTNGSSKDSGTFSAKVGQVLSQSEIDDLLTHSLGDLAGITNFRGSTRSDGMRNNNDSSSRLRDSTRSDAMTGSSRRSDGMRSSSRSSRLRDSSRSEGRLRADSQSEGMGGSSRKFPSNSPRSGKSPRRLNSSQDNMDGSSRKKNSKKSSSRSKSGGLGASANNMSLQIDEVFEKPKRSKPSRRASSLPRLDKSLKIEEIFEELEESESEQKRISSSSKTAKPRRKAPRRSSSEPDEKALRAMAKKAEKSMRFEDVFEDDSPRKRISSNSTAKGSKSQKPKKSKSSRRGSSLSRLDEMYEKSLEMEEVFEMVDDSQKKRISSSKSTKKTGRSPRRSSSVPSEQRRAGLGGSGHKSMRLVELDSSQSKRDSTNKKTKKTGKAPRRSSSAPDEVLDGSGLGRSGRKSMKIEEVFEGRTPKSRKGGKSRRRSTSLPKMSNNSSGHKSTRAEMGKSLMEMVTAEMNDSEKKRARPRKIGKTPRRSSSVPSISAEEAAKPTKTKKATSQDGKKSKSKSKSKGLSTEVGHKSMSSLGHRSMSDLGAADTPQPTVIDLMPLPGMPQGKSTGELPGIMPLPIDLMPLPGVSHKSTSTGEVSQRRNRTADLGMSASYHPHSQHEMAASLPGNSMRGRIRTSSNDSLSASASTHSVRRRRIDMASSSHSRRRGGARTTTAERTARRLGDSMMIEDLPDLLPQSNGDSRLGASLSQLDAKPEPQATKPQGRRGGYDRFSGATAGPRRARGNRSSLASRQAATALNTASSFAGDEDESETHDEGELHEAQSMSASAPAHTRTPTRSRLSAVDLRQKLANVDADSGMDVSIRGTDADAVTVGTCTAPKVTVVPFAQAIPKKVLEAKKKKEQEAKKGRDSFNDLAFHDGFSDLYDDDESGPIFFDG